jgi:hypothetical protein
VFIEVSNSQMFLNVNACFKILQMPYRSCFCFAGEIPAVWYVLTWVNVANRIFSTQFKTSGFFDRFSFRSAVAGDYSPAGHSIQLISNY